MKFKRILALIAMFVAFICGYQISNSATNVQADMVNSNYQMIAHGYDWGPAIDKVVINTSMPIKKTDLNQQTFKVSSSDTYIPSTARQVNKAYLSNVNGKAVDSNSSRYIALDLAVDPDLTVADPFSFNQATQLNTQVAVQFQISQQNPLYSVRNKEITGITPTQRSSQVSYPELKSFSKNYSFTYQDKHFGTQSMQYTSYQAPANGKRALIIWLHGAGEGYKDPNPVSLLGSRAVGLAQKKIQSHFAGGADVLVPQAKTYWLDTWTTDASNRNDYGALGSGGTTLVYPNTPDGLEQRSRYEDGLTSMIQMYLTSHPKVDRNRVYIGGCSNGGYMALRMMVKEPGKFSAAFPISEAYLDKNISDAQIDNIKSSNIWFTQSQNDPIVNPQTSTVPTYQRLIKAGAQNVHFTFMKDVHDETGQFKGTDGQPYQYLGHFSWINVLDDYPAPDYDGVQAKNSDGSDVTVMSWLSRQNKATDWR